MLIIDFTFGAGDAPSERKHGTFAAQSAGASNDRPYEIGLQLKCGVRLTRLQHRMDGASHSRVEQRRDPTAVNDAHRVVEALRRDALESHATLLEPHRPNGGRFAERRRHQRRIAQTCKKF